MESSKHGGARSLDSFESDHNQTQSQMIFVGGLPLDMDEDALRMYFSHYGEISRIEVKRSAKGKSKGFCFITFMSNAVVDEILADAPHEVGDAQVNVQKAEDPKTKKAQQDDRRNRKLLVGDIRKGFGHEEIRALLETIGPVEKITQLRSRNDDTCYCHAVMVNLADTQKLLEMRKIRAENGLKMKFRPYLKETAVEGQQVEPSDALLSSEKLENSNLQPPETGTEQPAGLVDSVQVPKSSSIFHKDSQTRHNLQVRGSPQKALRVTSSPDFKRSKGYLSIKEWWDHINNELNYRYNIDVREFVGLGLQ